MNIPLPATPLGLHRRPELPSRIPTRGPATTATASVISPRCLASTASMTGGAGTHSLGVSRPTPTTTISAPIMPCMPRMQGMPTQPTGTHRLKTNCPRLTAPALVGCDPVYEVCVN